MDEKVKVIIEKSAHGVSAYIPVIPGCIATGGSFEEVKDAISEALVFHLEGMKEDGLEVPAVFSRNYSLQYLFDLQTFLTFYNKIFTKRALSRITGINESLLSQYAAGLKHPREKQAKKIELGLHRLAHELLHISL